MDLAVLVLAILYLCGVPVGIPLAICGILWCVLNAILTVVKKKMGR